MVSYLGEYIRVDAAAALPRRSGEQVEVEQNHRVIR